MKLIIFKAADRLRFSDPKAGSARVPVATASGSGSDLSVSVVDVDAKVALDLRRDPSLSVVRPMPMTLIRPLSNAPASSTAAPAAMWGISAVGVDKSRRDGEGVTVAILDTGIAQAHDAFRGIELLTRNFTKEQDHDIDGHGTHCAGTIFGRDVDGRRIGIATGVKKAVIGKVLGKGGGSTDQLVEAINWAREQGADVISMSLGLDFTAYQKELVAEGLPPEIATSLALQGYRDNVHAFDELSRLYVDGRAIRSVVLVAAAGNESLRDRSGEYRVTVAPPAAGEAFVSVAAVGPAPRGEPGRYPIAPFSNSGARLSAPGVDIWSAAPDGGLTSMSGTSMAAPHVAGIAALWVQQLRRTTGPRERIDARRVIQQIERHAKSLDHLDFEDAGVGLVQAPKQEPK